MTWPVLDCWAPLASEADTVHLQLGDLGFPLCRTATLPDVRVVWMQRFLSLPLSKTLPLIVPRLLPLHRMLQQHVDGQPVQLPPSMSLSSEKLQEDGVYLAENGYDGYIYFAQQVPAQMVRALLGKRLLWASPDGWSNFVTLTNLLFSLWHCNRSGGWFVSKSFTCLESH